MEFEGATVGITNPEGQSEIVLVCEHASSHIPPEYKDLGLGSEARLSHIAWDPGARLLAERLSALLDATLITQEASRLLYDCNRPPEDATAVPATSEIFAVPGNAELSEEARAERVTRFYEPFRDGLRQLVRGRLADSRTPIIVTIHSFTPVYKGEPRSVEVGVLHDRDSRLADRMLELAKGTSDYDVQRNEPYGPQHGVTHTLKAHALPFGLLNVMIEVRNDLIADESGVERAAQFLAKNIKAALAVSPAGG